MQGDFTIGTSPITATFMGGSRLFANIGIYNHTIDVLPTRTAWHIANDSTGTITFEAPAKKVQFYAASLIPGDAEIKVFNTNNNLLTSISDVPKNMSIVSSIPPPLFDFRATELGSESGISKVTYTNSVQISLGTDYQGIALDDFGFTPIDNFEPPPAESPSITIQPTSQEVQSGSIVILSVAAIGDDLSYQWYTGNSGDITNPVAGASDSILTTVALPANTSFWVQVINIGGSINSETAVITLTVPPVPLILEGSGEIAGEDIQHPNGYIFDQVLLTGESIQLQAKSGQITRVSFMDENEDIVQVEFSGTGTVTVNLDPATFSPAILPPRYNQQVEYVIGIPSVVIDGADSSTFFSIFTVGRINALNQALFPEGQIYDAQADVTLVEVINSTGIGGMQLSNTVFRGNTGKVGVDARGVPIAVRLTVGDIDASEDAIPHLLFGEGSFTVPASNPGLRITGGDLAQTNGTLIIVAESGSTTPGFETLITHNNFKSDNTPQPTQSINTTCVNEDGEEITVPVEEVMIE